MTKGTDKARKALDRRFNAMKPYETFACPPKGWIRAIRDALGMTTAQLAKRMHIAQPTLSAFEKREFEGTITLNSLEKAAQAMGCRLIYAIVPQESLEEITRGQAKKIAREMFSKIEHSMSLEKQEVTEPDRRVQFENLVNRLIRDAGRIWDEPSD
jgi:predicted DNA-binding mobile mystery protein A